MSAKFDSRAPLYLQVIHYYKVQIASGALKPGEEMPSRRELARLFKINPNTVQRAYKEMEEQGLIYTDRNMPSKVTNDANLLNVVRNELLMEAVEELVQTIKPINVPLEEIVALIKHQYRSDSEGGQDD